MEIEVITNELNELSNYLNEKSEEIKNDLQYINDISIQLNKHLHGLGQQVLSSRITNFNTTQLGKIVDYTKILGEELKTAVKIYDSEEDYFSEKVKREAMKYNDAPLLNSDIPLNDDLNNTTSVLIDQNIPKI